LEQLQEDSVFVKFIQKCEANPKLHKLILADMLSKPLQRITRYPLLFNRLLPNLTPNSREHILLSEFLFKIRQLLTSLNETVKKKESAYRIKMIDEEMDFGTIMDVLLLLILEIQNSNQRKRIIAGKILYACQKGRNHFNSCNCFLI
jgi:hypothetical protein